MSERTTARKPVLLLTGFLGAGKTTLLKRWLDEAPATGRRPGILMNEFGRESVDTALLQRQGLVIQEVAGGCLCCADDGEVGRGILQLAARPDIDYIVVETSGLAEPDAVIDGLTGMEFLDAVRLHSVITVVDGLWYARPGEESGERILARRQIQFAHIIAVSKCDLIHAAERDQVDTLLREINPHAEIIRLPFGLPEPGKILDSPGATLDMSWPEPGEVPRHHLHSQYQTVGFRFPVPVDRSRFEAFLSSLPPREVVRIKGFVRFTGSPDKLHIFQSVFGTHMIEEFRSTPRPGAMAVLIGPGLDVSAMQDRLRKLAFGGRTGGVPLDHVERVADTAPNILRAEQPKRT